MTDTSFNKLKKSALDFASASAAKIESITHTGKVHLDLLAEEHRLQEKFARLGEKTHQAVQADKFTTLTEDPYVVELLGAISENQSRIADLRAKLKKAD
jgi:hypothetical protein